MRPACFAALILGLTNFGAQAAELQILAPPVVNNAGLKELAADFTKETGVPVTIKVEEMLKISEAAHTQPADIVFVQPNLMAAMLQDHSIMPGSAMPLGRVNIGLAVKAGAPHPDISTVPKLVAAMESAKIGVAYSNPDPARGSMVAKMVDDLLKRKEFSGVHGVISSKGNGVSGLMNGEGDMALQLETEILPHKEVELVGALPPELKEYIDISVAVSAKTVDAPDAQAFIRFLTRPEALDFWRTRGLDN